MPSPCQKVSRYLTTGFKDRFKLTVTGRVGLIHQLCYDGHIGLTTEVYIAKVSLRVVWLKLECTSQQNSIRVLISLTAVKPIPKLERGNAV